MIYCRSDLACEIEPGELCEEDGAYHHHRRGGVEIATLHIRSDAFAKRVGKPKGSYVTVSSGKLHTLSNEGREEVCEAVAEALRQMAEQTAGRAIDGSFRLLVAGLGNEEITPDAIGPLAVKQITVTRHIKESYPAVYSSLGSCEIAALAPGVLGQTGIETAELIRGAAENVRPDLVVVIDALAARSCDRLAATIQLSDTGIAPGSGIGNRRRAIDRESVGYPVLSLGVPTVVDSATLVYDALARAGISEIEPELERVLENGRSFFVSPKESDTITREVAALLAEVVGAAFALT